MVDAAVEYACATNAGGQYCGVAQHQNVIDVCAPQFIAEYSSYC